MQRHCMMDTDDRFYHEQRKPEGSNRPKPCWNGIRSTIALFSNLLWSLYVF